MLFACARLTFILTRPLFNKDHFKVSPPSIVLNHSVYVIIICILVIVSVIPTIINTIVFNASWSVTASSPVIRIQVRVINIFRYAAAKWGKGARTAREMVKSRAYTFRRRNGVSRREHLADLSK